MTAPLLTCTFHPSRETSLRCNRCEAPICSKCAVLTPTGYRCKSCVRSQQKVFNTAKWYDYPLGFLSAALLSYTGSLIAPKLGFFVLFLAPLAGVIVSEAARFLTRRRRAKNLFIVITAGTLLGALPETLGTIVNLILFLPQVEFSFGLMVSSLWHGAYAIMVTSTVYYRVSGISIGR